MNKPIGKDINQVKRKLRGGTNETKQRRVQRSSRLLKEIQL